MIMQKVMFLLFNKTFRSVVRLAAVAKHFVSAGNMTEMNLHFALSKYLHCY